MKAVITVLLMIFVSGACVWGASDAKDYSLSSGLEVMQVALDRHVPVIRAYCLNTGEQMAAETGESVPVIRFCSVREGTNYDTTDKDARVEYQCSNNPGSVTYSGKLFWKDKPALDFALMFSLSGNQLNITCKLVKEAEGFQLLSVEMPSMLTVEAAKGAKLVIPRQSGRLVDVGRSLSQTHEIGADSADPLRLAMVYDQESLGMLSVNSLDDRLFASITGAQPKRAMLWVRFVQRPEASSPKYQILAQYASTCTITIIGKQAKSSPTWMDGARYFRAKINASPNPLYTNSFVYSVLCDVPGAENYTTFADCLKLIEEVGALTGAKQIVYLAGWQHTGRNTGFPDVFTVNERLGGESGLKDLMSRAKGYNALVSLQDNYDDAYKESPGWDNKVILRDSAGELAKGSPKEGGEPFLISPMKYASAMGGQRIAKTIEMYPVEKTIYLDDFSADAPRCDFNPEIPAGAHKNLQGKLKIVEQFQRHGLDVVSDGFNACFVDKIKHFRHLKHDTSQVFSNEEVIPLVPFIFHAKAGMADDLKGDGEMLRALLYGVGSSGEYTKDTSREEICDMFYLVSLPWTKLSTREMTQYQKNGDVERVDYDKNTYVEINLKKKSYKVVIDGSTLGKDFTATTPIDKKTFAVYSRAGGDVSFTAPASWDIKKLKAFSLKSDGSKERVELGAEGRTLTLSTRPHVPYWITTE